MFKENNMNIKIKEIIFILFSLNPFSLLNFTTMESSEELTNVPLEEVSKEITTQQETPQETPQENAVKMKKIEAERMFNLAEKCVSEYMCSHLKMKPEDLLESCSALNAKTIPLFLYPIKEYNDKYLSLSIDIVPYDYICYIPEQLKDDESINHSLGFIYHSVTTVFNTIFKSNIKKNAAETVISNSFHLEMNDENLTMYPVYLYPPRRGEFMLLQIKQEMEYELSKYPINVQLLEPLKSQIDELREQYLLINKHLDDNKYDKVTADENEKLINDSFKKNDRIGVVFREISKEDFENF